jgi:fumarate hydratase class II
LNSKLSEITSVVSAGDFAPTRQSYEVFQAVSDEIEPHLVTLQETIAEDVEDFDNLVQELGIPAVVGRPQ